MSKIAYVVSLFFVLIAHNHVWAGTVDLSIEISPSSINGVSAGNTGEFNIVITNNGPDDAGSNSSLSYPISINTERIFFGGDEGSIDFAINNDITQDCVFSLYILDPIPGDLPSVIYSFRTPIIPSGTSITCYGFYYANFDHGIRTVEWSPLSITDNDTDPSNDISLMTFRGYVAPVPSLSLYGLILLALAMISISKYHTKN